MATLEDGAVWEVLGSTSFEVARGILWDALGALGDACMTVRSLVDEQDTRAVPAGMEESMPVALRSAIERRDALYEFFVELYAAEPQQGAAATAGRRPAATEAPRISAQDPPPARERSRSPRMGPVGGPSVPYLLETTADVRRRIDVLQRNLEQGCASSELEALQRLLWYREGYVGHAGSGSRSSGQRRHGDL